MTFQEILTGLLGPLGLLVGVLFILWAGWKGIWVFGRSYKQLDDEWRLRYEEMRGDLLARNKKLEERQERILTEAETGSTLAKQVLREAEIRRAGALDDRPR